MNHEELILDHYKKVAKFNGLNPTSSMEDQYIRQNEITFILSEIERYIETLGARDISIFELGCGNGYLLSKIRERFSQVKLFAIEFTPELFELAKSRNIENCSIEQGDIRTPDFFKEKVDIVITERVVINILAKKDQYQVLRNISEMIRPGGIYVMVESFHEPLVVLNKARKEMGLDPLSASKHNRYLRELMSDYLAKSGTYEIEGTMPKNFLSTHFYLTRVYHAIVRPGGGRVKGSLFLSFMTEALPVAIGNFAPILFRVFKKGSP